MRAGVAKAIVAGCFCAALLSQSVFGSSIRGIVVDAENQAPLEKVMVYLSGTSYQATTAPDGRFAIESVPAGEYLLVATAVGFGLVKQKLLLTSESVAELEILLNAGTQIRNDVTVAADADIASPRLTGSEIFELKSVFVDDPFRALQQLPGVVSSDDFMSSFAVQGSGFDRVGMLFDGIPVYAFLHTIEGHRDTGSTSVLSAELIQEIDLLTPGSTAEVGGASAGYLRMESRSGNEDRWRGLLSVSGSSVMGLSEGPVGKGSWIASARKSYIDWIVKRIDERAELNFGFHDFFAKLVQRKGDKHTFAFSAFYGNTGQENVQENIGLNTVDNGRFASSLIHGNWTFTPSGRATISTHGYWQGADSLNRNREGRLIWENDLSVIGLRTVADLRPVEPLVLSVGLTAESQDGSKEQVVYDYSSRNWQTTSDFAKKTSRFEAFAQAAVSVAPSVTVSAGANWNRLAATNEAVTSPFVSLQWKPGPHLFSLSLGETHQFPFLAQLYGQYANPGLRGETARGVEAGWVWNLPRNSHIRMSAFRRVRHDVPWKVYGWWRLVNGVITPPSSDPFANALEDRSSGAEIQLGRRSASGLSGWLGYAWAQSQWSEVPGRWFPGNYDQRHGISVFAKYRWSSQFDLSAKWKFATGLPVPAYVRRTGGQYYVAEHRNLERLPNYSRVDVRFAKSFNKDRYRLTLFFEALNLLNRDNVRFTGIGYDFVNRQTGRVSELDHTQIPILPTAGLVVEF